MIPLVVMVVLVVVVVIAKTNVVKHVISWSKPTPPPTGAATVATAPAVVPVATTAPARWSDWIMVIAMVAVIGIGFSFAVKGCFDLDRKAKPKPTLSSEVILHRKIIIAPVNGWSPIVEVPPGAKVIFDCPEGLKCEGLNGGKHFTINGGDKYDEVVGALPTYKYQFKAIGDKEVTVTLFWK